MTTSDQTICAISTPPGVGGIAVIRVSGPDAIPIVGSIFHGAKPLDQFKSHTAHLGDIIDPDQPDDLLDQAVVTLFLGPHSFTGEDTVEISVHGSPYIQSQLLSLLVRQGCRLAQPGEYTRRAFTNGRLDLARAEAVADIIAARSRAAHRLASSQMRGHFSDRLNTLRQSLLELSVLLELELDFSEEDVTFASREKLLDIAKDVTTQIDRLHRSFNAGNAIRRGIPVAIVGPTNAGKSSLLNALIGDDRAIVSDIHGTTRDTIEETITLGDFEFRFIDTAGIRHATDTIERQGIERSLRALDSADIIIQINDVTSPSDPTIAAHVERAVQARPDFPPRVIAVSNKIDLLDTTATPPSNTIPLSTLTRAGLDTLTQTLIDSARQMTDTCTEGDIIVTNVRHAQALAAAATSGRRLIQSLTDLLPADLIAQDLRETIAHLAAITGDIPSSTILNTIFSRFCIGK